MPPTTHPFVRWPCSPPHGHRGGSLAVHTPCTPCGRPAWSLLSLGAAAARPLRPLERAGAAGRRCRPVRPQNSGENRCEPPPPRPERPAPLLWPGQGTALRAPRVHRRRAVAPLEARPDCPHPPHRSWRQRGRLGPRAGRAQLIPGLLSLRGGVGAQRLLASRTRR